MAASAAEVILAPLPAELVAPTFPREPEGPGALVQPLAEPAAAAAAVAGPASRAATAEPELTSAPVQASPALVEPLPAPTAATGVTKGSAPAAMAGVAAVVLGHPARS
jgi:hypothetical protein